MTNRKYDQFTSPGAVRDYLCLHLAERKYEIFYCLFLDSQHRLLDGKELFRGTIDGCSVYPREVVKATLEINAAAVILAHNHPSGVAEPSAADRQITDRLKNALALVDVRVLDHFWSAIKMLYRLPSEDGFSTLLLAHDTTVSWATSEVSPDRCRHIV